jgi:hypothetical protein
MTKLAASKTRIAVLAAVAVAILGVPVAVAAVGTTADEDHRRVRRRRVCRLHGVVDGRRGWAAARLGTTTGDGAATADVDPGD